MTILKKATRRRVKLRMSISAPTGYGKTWSALLLANGLAPWEKICVIDTENASAQNYSHLGDFYTVEIEPPFTPEKYTEAIKAAEGAGMEVIIIDSVTHVWSMSGGLLEYKDSLGGKYQDWAKVTPRYQKWLDSILHSKAHVITTIRKKQAYSITNENGKTKVEKQGMEDQIRDGFDYEMTIAFTLINDKHMAATAKDRTGLFADKPEFVITRKTGETIKDWCEQGDAPEVKDTRELMTPSHERFSKMVVALTLGKTTLEAVEEKFRLDDDAKARVYQAIENAKIPATEPMTQEKIRQSLQK